VHKQGPVALYDSLARFQWWRRTLARSAPGAGLEMRKRLNPSPTDGPSDGCAGLDHWLMQQMGDPPRRRLLDLGCGFGASLLRWLPPREDADPGAPDAGAPEDGHAFGVTPSGYQVRRARQIANQSGVGARCTFLQQNLEAELPSDLDVILAIEALGHTADLPKVLRQIRQALRPAGKLIWLEDLLRAPAAADADVATLANEWSSPPLRDVASVRRDLQAAGLQLVEEWDLTPQVPHRSLPQIQRSQAAASRWRRFTPLPFARRIAQAFVGGFALERLYAREMTCYRVLLATPCEDSK
jgi:SAM-dependent methyltransferase